MKQTQCILLIGLTLSISNTLAVNPVMHERQSSGRYDKLTEDWPFSMATRPISPPETPEGPFAKFYVSGIGKTRENGKEQVFVAISSKDKQMSFSLFGSEKGHDDIWVADVEWNDQVGKSRVTLKKGNETGTIGFDEMAIRTPLNLNRTIPEPKIFPRHSPQRTPDANSRVRVIR